MKNNTLPVSWNGLAKTLVVLGIVALDLILGMLANSIVLVVLVGVAGAGAVFFALNRRIEIGLLLMVLASFFGRWNIGTGSNVPINLTILLLAYLLAFWLLRSVVSKEFKLLPSRVNLPALIFVLFVTVSTIAGSIPWIPLAAARASLEAQLGGWLMFIFSIGAFLYIGNNTGDMIWLKRLTWLFVIVGTIFLTMQTIRPLKDLSPLIFVSGFDLGSNYWQWAAAFATAELLFDRKLNLVGKLFLVEAIGVIFYIGWFNNREWVSGWLPPMVAVFAIIWLRSWKLGAVVSAIAGVYLLLNFQGLTASVMSDTQQYSLFSREATWPIMLQLIKASPILGLGPSNYYHYTPLFPILGWSVKFNSHNNYVDIIAETGLLGMAAFVWLIAEIGFLGLRLKNRVNSNFGQVYVNFALGGMAAMLVSGFLGDWFIPFVYNISTSGFRFSIFNWLFLGGLIVLDHFDPGRTKVLYDSTTAFNKMGE